MTGNTGAERELYGFCRYSREGIGPGRWLIFVMDWTVPGCPYGDNQADCRRGGCGYYQARPLSRYARQKLKALKRAVAKGKA